MYGADRQLLALVRASRQLCEPVVLLPVDVEYDGSLSAALRAEGIEVRHGPIPVLRRRYGSLGAMARWTPRAIRGWWWAMQVARETRARLVVSNTTAIPVGPTIAGLLRLPHLWLAREIIDSPAWYRSMVRANGRLSRGHIFTVSDAVGRWLGPVRGHGPSTLHDGVPLAAKTRPLPATPTALFIGRMNELKGWEVFIQAATIAHERVPEARFQLVGGTVPGADIDAATVDGAVQRADPSGAWLRWFGEQPSTSTFVDDCWLVAVPSIRPDSFPNAVLEGMAQARAVIGSDLGGIPEMIVHGETGRLVPPGDVASLASAMEAMLADRDEAARMGAAGRERVVREFSSMRLDAAWRAILARELSSVRS